jgi:YHS domain-containing protein
MKKLNYYLLLSACAAGLMAFAAKAAAGDSTMPSCCGGMTSSMAESNTNGVPDLMKTCPVSGDKLGGDMGGPYVFSYKGQEVKLCCKSCKKDFDKNPEKYIKLIRAADKTADQK